MRRARPLLLGLVAVGAVGCEEDHPGLSPVAPVFALDRATVELGSVYVGFSAQAALTISNRGDGILTLTAITLEPGPFTVVGAPERMGPGAEGMLVLQFAPTAVGPSIAKLVIESDDAAHPRLDVEIHGAGLETPNCDDANVCTDDRFDPVVALCLHDAKGGSCDDGSGCTEDDRCEAGVCVGDAIECDDDVECTRDLCDPATGCVFLPNHDVCKDDDVCSLDICGADGCENPQAPDGHPCGDYVTCESIDVCIVGFCVGVSIPDGAPCSDGSACTLLDRCAGGACVGTATITAPTVLSETFLFDNVVSASFAEDHLYVTSIYDDAQRFTVLAKANNDLAPVTAVRELDGNARLVHLAGDLYARVATSTGVSHHLDVVDLSDPERPSLVLRRRGPGTVSYLDPVLLVDDHLFYCASPTGGGWDAELFQVEIADPMIPGLPQSLGLGPCTPTPIAAGRVWVSWQNGGGGRGGGAAEADSNRRIFVEPIAAVQIWRLSGSGIELVLDYTFNTMGPEMYGQIFTAALDGHRLLVDVAHPTSFLSFDLDVQTPVVTPVTINLGAPNFLTGLYEGQAYLHALAQLRAVDLSDPTQPQPLSYSLPLPGWPEFASVLTFSDDALALLSGDGRLVVAPRQGPGPIQPFVLRAEGSIDRLYRQSNGLYGLAAESALLFDRGWVGAPDVAAAPIASPWRAGQLGVHRPTIVDGPDGALGVFSKRRSPQECLDGSPCDQTTLIATATTVPSIALLPGGTVAIGADYPVVRTDPDEHFWSMAVDGCQGIVFSPVVRPATRNDRVLIVDRCSTASDPTLRSIAAIDLPTTTDYWDVKIRAHDDRVHTVLLADTAVWVDLAGLAFPTYARLELGGRPLVDAYEAGTWAIAVELPSGDTELQIWDIAFGVIPTLQSSIPLPDVTRASLAKAWIEWPLLYIGLDDATLGELRVFDLGGTAPLLLHRLPMPARPMELLFEDDLIYVGRTDGITLLKAPCPSR